MSVPEPADGPVFRSLALDGVGRFDYADVILVSKPPHTSDDPRVWAETVFSRQAAPAWVQAAMGLRMALAPLIGLRPAPRGVFDVRRVEGEEALISFDDVHLSFRCAVGVDAAASVVRVTTVVVLHGWRGRIYFAPVSLVHPLVVHAMLRGARRVLARSARR